MWRKREALAANDKQKRRRDHVTASFFQGEHSISRVLSHLRGDDYLSSQPIARLLKRRNPEGQRATSTLPYSVLLRMGFTKPAGLPTAGALLPHLSTLTTCVAVSFSMALSLGSLPPDVIRHPALRSSDFPHALRPAIIFPARVLQYSMETGFFQEKDKNGFVVSLRRVPPQKLTTNPFFYISLKISSALLSSMTSISQTCSAAYVRRRFAKAGTMTRSV